MYAPRQQGLIQSSFPQRPAPQLLQRQAPQQFQRPPIQTSFIPPPPAPTPGLGYVPTFATTAPPVLSSLAPPPPPGPRPLTSSPLPVYPPPPGQYQNPYQSPVPIQSPPQFQLSPSAYQFAPPKPSKSFWDSAIAIIIGIVVVLLLLGLVIYLIIRKRSVKSSSKAK